MAPLFLLSLLICLSSSGVFAQEYPPLYSVPALDLSRYQGIWYEIGTSTIFAPPNSFIPVCTRANYTITSDANGPYVIVDNQSRRAVDAEPFFIIGRADVKDPSKPGEIYVSFFNQPVPEPNYYVIEINEEAKDYEYALVGTPPRESLWILSRTPTMSNETYSYLLAVAEKNGFEVEEIGFAKTLQEGCW